MTSNLQQPINSKTPQPSRSLQPKTSHSKSPMPQRPSILLEHSPRRQPSNKRVSFSDTQMPRNSIIRPPTPGGQLSGSAASYSNEDRKIKGDEKIVATSGNSANASAAKEASRAASGERDGSKSGKRVDELFAGKKGA